MCALNGDTAAMDECYEEMEEDIGQRHLHRWKRWMSALRRRKETLERDTAQTEEMDECMQETGLKMGALKRLRREIEEIEQIRLVDIVQGIRVGAPLGTVEHEACDEVLLVFLARLEFGADC